MSPQKILKLKSGDRLFTSTVVDIMKQIKTKYNLSFGAEYRTILRRERARVPVYLTVQRDPTNGYRVYTFAQVKKILHYELKRIGREDLFDKIEL